MKMKRGEDLLKMFSTMYSNGLKAERQPTYTGQHVLDRERTYKFRDLKNMMPLYGVGGLRK